MLMTLGWSTARHVVVRRRELIGKFAFELVIVFVGVTAAFALENVRERATEAHYRTEMVAAMRPTLDDTIRHNAAFDHEVAGKLAAFDAAIAAGKEPALPFFRETNSERPPIRAWDGLVASGAARAISPALFFRLALFYTRQESFGERYVRYNDFTEQRVLAAGNDPAVFYDPATHALRPEFSAYVNRLRDLQVVGKQITQQAIELRDALAKIE
jgi:hypothetical protein